jgi:RIO kinase 1
MQFLQRDCANICDWFAGRGIERDPDELLGLLAARAFGRF